MAIRTEIINIIVVRSQTNRVRQRSNHFIGCGQKRETNFSVITEMKWEKTRSPVFNALLLSPFDQYSTYNTLNFDNFTTLNRGVATCTLMRFKQSLDIPHVAVVLATILLPGRNVL
jgi:hypothetical protein